jgi:ABC-type transport system involved in cytochrome bd biosynthesis fused ATPase/permease subunit
MLCSNALLPCGILFVMFSPPTVSARTAGHISIPGLSSFSFIHGTLVGGLMILLLALTTSATQKQQQQQEQANQPHPQQRQQQQTAAVSSDQVSVNCSCVSTHIQAALPNYTNVVLE